MFVQLEQPLVSGIWNMEGLHFRGVKFYAQCRFNPDCKFCLLWRMSIIAERMSICAHFNNRVSYVSNGKVGGAWERG